jgi:gamma-glutamyltranspeptidase/glutathione hydrolase
MKLLSVTTLFLAALLPLAFSETAAPPCDAVAVRHESESVQQGKDITWKASGKRGAVATGAPEAVQAGLTLLQNGGNAADAAAATIFALTFTESAIVCYGGEVPILVYDAKRDVVEVISGMGTAPKLATREYFAKKGGIPPKGIESAAVPATVAACLTLLERYGTKTFAEVSAPLLALLDGGNKAWHADLARTIRQMIEAEKASPKDRIRGLRLVGDYFYRGPVARDIDAWSRANGGLLRYTDLATFTAQVEEPVAVEYRGHVVYKCGCWTQGPYLLETLRLLEGYDLAKMGHNSADTVHIAVEAMKLGLADRDFWYADPLFATVPLEELLSPKYAALRRSLIDPKSASQEQRPGDPVGGKALYAKPDFRTGPGAVAHDTTSCVVADGQGNMVAATPSGFNTTLVGKTGINVGCRLQSFNIWEGHANCIEPGKRPRITLTPGLVLKDGKPCLALSIAGGDMQDQTALQLLMNHIDFGMSPAQAVAAPRFGTGHFMSSFRQQAPALGSLYLMPDFAPAIVQDLKNRGHKVSIVKGSMGAAPVMLHIDPNTGVIEAAGDTRARRHAGAF